MSLTNFCVADDSEISQRWTKQITKVDDQKNLTTLYQAQNIWNSYSVAQNIYITDTMVVHNTTMQSMMTYIKDWQQDCKVDTWDIINIMHYDEVFDAYMWLITTNIKLKKPVWSSAYYNNQAASCLKIAWCLYKTNKLVDLVNNQNITNSNLVKICQEQLPSMYWKLHANNEKFHDINKQQIGNDIYINGDETDATFDILADIKYIWDIMFCSNESPSKLYTHDLQKIKKQVDIDASQNTNWNTQLGYEDNVDNLTLLAQASNAPITSTDLLNDPDVKKLLWDDIYNRLSLINAGVASWSSNLSYIKSYIKTTNTKDQLQQKDKIQDQRERANPTSNSTWVTDVTNAQNKNNLKTCLKSCTSASNAVQLNACRNSCLCGQLPKDGWETVTWSNKWTRSSVMVVRYCAEPYNMWDMYKSSDSQCSTQTIEWLLLEIHKALQVIDNADTTPRTISRENRDIDLSNLKLDKVFNFTLHMDTIVPDAVDHDKKPDLINNTDKINSNVNNPLDPKLFKMQSELDFQVSMRKWITRNITFWQNLNDITKNINQVALELKNRIPN